MNATLEKIIQRELVFCLRKLLENGTLELNIIEK